MLFNYTIAWLGSRLSWARGAIERKKWLCAPAMCRPRFVPMQIDGDGRGTYMPTRNKYVTDSSRHKFIPRCTRTSQTWQRLERWLCLWNEIVHTHTHRRTEWREMSKRQPLNGMQWKSLTLIDNNAREPTQCSGHIYTSVCVCVMCVYGYVPRSRRNCHTKIVFRFGLATPSLCAPWSPLKWTQTNMRRRRRPRSGKERPHNESRWTNSSAYFLRSARACLFYMCISRVATISISLSLALSAERMRVHVMIVLLFLFLLLLSVVRAVLFIL